MTKIFLNRLVTFKRLKYFVYFLTSLFLLHILVNFSKYDHQDFGSFLHNVIDSASDQLADSVKSNDSEDDTEDPSMMLTTTCPAFNSLSEGKLQINETISLEDAEAYLESNVHFGGSFAPLNCTSRWKIAIIVCFRNRDEHLGPLTYHLHKLLQQQHLSYTIYIVNQTDSYPFNRAKLFNVGYLEALKKTNFDCFFFHDVDFLPENDRLFYYCTTMPRRMVMDYNFRGRPNVIYMKNEYFGGVIMLTKEHMETINGFSNSFWGWGGEDDNIRRRLLKKNFVIWTYPKTIGRFRMLGHKQMPPNKERFNLLKKTETTMDKDGLNSLKYKLVSKVPYQLFTSINVDISEQKSSGNKTI